MVTNRGLVLSYMDVSGLNIASEYGYVWNAKSSWNSPCASTWVCIRTSQNVFRSAYIVLWLVASKILNVNTVSCRRQYTAVKSRWLGCLLCGKCLQYAATESCAFPLQKLYTKSMSAYSLIKSAGIFGCRDKHAWMHNNVMTMILCSHLNTPHELLHCTDTCVCNINLLFVLVCTSLCLGLPTF
jgi:hypothetical protein